MSTRKYWEYRSIAAGEHHEVKVVFSEGSGWLLRFYRNTYSLNLVVDGIKIEKATGNIVAREAFCVYGGGGSHYSTLIHGDDDYVWIVTVRVAVPHGGSAATYYLFAYTY